MSETDNVGHHFEKPMTAFNRYVLASWIVLLASHAVAQDKSIADLDPEMAVSKETVDGLDWYDVTQWGSRGALNPIKSDSNGSIVYLPQRSNPSAKMSGTSVAIALA